MACLWILIIENLAQYKGFMKDLKTAFT